MVKCSDCRRKTKPRDVRMTFRGLKISTFKSGMYCYNCFKKQTFKRIREQISRGYFMVSAGHLEINWKQCFMAYSHESEFDHDWTFILIILLMFNVVSYRPQKHYVVHRDGEPFMLHQGGFQFYFTAKKEAEAFVAACVERYGANYEFSILKFA